MQSISNTIYQTYLTRLTELTPQKKFHFANRLSSWSADKQAAATLTSFAPNIHEAEATLTDLVARRFENDHTINFPDLRTPYFTQYPWLYGLELALFQARHWRMEYDIDTFAYFRNNDSFALWKAGVEQLQADAQACATLSTYAVNTIYLWYRLVQKDERVLFTVDEPAYFEVNTVLAIYFSTHCCLGETLFYARAIPANRVLVCRALLSRAELIAKNHLDSLPLDALLELIVAAKLCGAVLSIQDAILARASSHFDTSLGYITDPKKPDKNDLNGAEHRNVLYLMATTQPRQELIAL